MELYLFLILQKALLRTAPHASWSLLYDTRYWKALASAIERWMTSPHFSLISSTFMRAIHNRGASCFETGWSLRKIALSTGHSKVK